MTKLTRTAVAKLVLENDRAVERALIVLFRRQTAGERASNTTANWNEIGFTGADAHWGCRNAKQVIAGKPLGASQLGYWRKLNSKGVPRIAKYWAQLAEAAVAKQLGVPDPALKRLGQR